MRWILIFVILPFFYCGVYGYELHPDSIAKYERILNGLDKSYIINRFYDEFYRKNKTTTLSELEKQDSIIYFKAVHDFYDSDFGIIYYLLTFYKDSSECHWIRTFNTPRAFKLPIDVAITRKYLAALILIESYFAFDETRYWISIPRRPVYFFSEPQEPLVLFDFDYLLTWKPMFPKREKKSMKRLSKDIRFYFKNYQHPYYKVYEIHKSY